MGKVDFSNDFKRDAAHQITDQGYPIAQVSRWRSRSRVRRATRRQPIRTRFQRRSKPAPPATASKTRTCQGTTVSVQIKRFKRVALCCEKTKRNFASFVALTADFILLKSVHTA